MDNQSTTIQDVEDNYLLLKKIDLYVARLERKVAQYYNPQFSTTGKEISEARQDLKNQIAKLNQKAKNESQES